MVPGMRRERTGGGQELGIREARGEVVIFIDDDIFCPAPSGNTKYHEREENLIVDGPAINIGEGDFSFADRDKGSWPSFDFCLVCDANTSCRREHLLKAGGSMRNSGPAGTTWNWVFVDGDGFEEKRTGGPLPSL